MQSQIIIIHSIYFLINISLVNTVCLLISNTCSLYFVRIENPEKIRKLEMRMKNKEECENDKCKKLLKLFEECEQRQRQMKRIIIEIMRVRLKKPRRVSPIQL